MQPRLPPQFFGVVLALGLAAASLLPLHYQPQTVFASEWIAACSPMLALLVATLTCGLQPRVPRGMPLWLGLALLVVTGAWTIAGGSLGYPLYGALFLLAWVAGGMAVQAGVHRWLALGLLACALLQAVAGGLQLANLDMGGWVLRKIYLQTYGNAGQANHYADLIYLGLASLAWWWARGLSPRAIDLVNGSLKSAGAGQARDKLGMADPCPVWWDAGLVLLGAALAISAAFSASRGVWLYVAGFVVLGGVALKRGDAPGRRCGLALLVLAVISVLAQLAVAYSGVLDYLGLVSSIERAGDAGSNGQRLYNWYAAWKAIQAHPWLGEGPGSFYKASIDAMFHTAPATFPKFAEHAHNLPLNLAAELGLPLAVLLTFGLVGWFWRHLTTRPLSAARLWALAVVAVIGLHSLVEYPLWYAYFVVPFGLCMGAADGEREPGRALRVPSSLMAGVCLVGLVALAWIMHDWLAVRDAYRILNEEEPNVALQTREAALRRLQPVSHLSVFALTAEGLRLQSWRAEDGGADGIAQRCDRTWQYKPGWYLMMRCGEAYALTGREAALERLARAGCDGFPKHRQALAEWAQGFDDRDLAVLRITGRACLQ